MITQDRTQDARVATAGRPLRVGSGLRGRGVRGRIFEVLGLLSIALALTVLGILFVQTFIDGVPYLTRTFFTSFDSRFADRAGLRAGIIGTAYVISLTIVVAVPLGVMAALYLEEYAGDTWFRRVVEINLNNLAAVPSIIYGLLGLQVFARLFMLDRSIITGALTLALVILPIIIVAAREAIRAVPPSIREASYGLGATKWETMRYHVLPIALPGILTGGILGVSRAIGEVAPLIMIGALTLIRFDPRSFFDYFTVMPIQIFNWISRPQQEFKEVAAAGILVLLALLLVINATAIIIRQRSKKRF